jgi:pimeloyl-ACP methyl ester carboxylesterase
VNQLLTSLTDDTAALRRVIERVDRPVILVAHAYAGAVIAAAHDDRVKSLVFVTALAPDEGETVRRRLLSRCAASRSSQARTGCLWTDLDAGGGLLSGGGSQGLAGSDCHNGWGAAADRCEIHPGKESHACMENHTIVVSRCGRGPHDRPRDPELYGRANGCNHLFIPHRPRSDVHSTESRS